MTTEEKITELINIRDNFNYTLAPREVFDDAIKALRQEPCEDAISRRAVIDIIHHYKNDRDSQLSDLTDGVCNLPSVQPESKTGHWTKEETIYGWDGKSYQCSCCGRSIHLDTVMEDLDDYPYCHCGAKMEDVQKGE